MHKLTLGSLFDGSGGFPLGGLLCGITSVWASEIEPFPIRVTTKRLPNMKHYGDISTMDGGTIEPVDIITFGSPCTDMSVAGKRAGLDGKQSVLFYEAIRIVKEMRCATHGKYPRYICWENVPGAFSSNKGADFKAVLEAVISVTEPGTEVPAPENGKWPYADCYMGDGWSVAYRTVDAQHFGVAQRRRRIYLVADFAGGRAREILFEPAGVSRNFAPCFSAWQGTARDAAAGSGSAGICLNDQGGNRMDVTDEVTATLRAEAHHPPCVLQSAGFCTEHSAKSRSVGFEEETAPTLRAGTIPGVAIENHPTDGRIRIREDGTVQTLTSRMGTGGMNVPLTLKVRSGCEGGGKGALVQEDKSATLSCNNEQAVFVPTVFDIKQVTSKQNRSNPKQGSPCHTLAAGNADSAVLCYGICSDASNSMKSANPHSGIYEADTARTLDGNGGNPGCNQGGIAVVAIQGSMVGRNDKNGPQGDGVNEDVCFTLNTVDKHAVAYSMTTGGFGVVSEEQTATLMARDYKDVPLVSQPYQKVAGTIAAGAHPSGFNGQDAYSDRLIPVLHGSDYIVRRLTPTECARLQGFPDWWCADLGTENPTEKELAFWTEVWETHRRIVAPSVKPKTKKQILKWLKNPHSDAAEYKMWGNGVALPCVCFVLKGIAEAENEGTD